MTMVDRIAKLIMRQDMSLSQIPGIEWDQLDESTQAKLRDDAREIIASMREPNQRMLVAGVHAERGNAFSVWQTMIDAALAEGDTA